MVQEMFSKTIQSRNAYYHENGDAIRAVRDVLPVLAVASSGFAVRDLAVLSYAQGFTHWHYKAGTCMSAIVADPMGFFAGTHDMIVPGDRVTVTSPDGALELVRTRAGMADMMHRGGV